MSTGPLLAQLQVLRAQLALDPERHELRVEIAASLRDIQRIANAPDAEPLPQLLARLAQGHITTAHAGVAISRDMGVASQVAKAVDLSGAQAGDVTIGEVASSIYHIHYGGPRP